MSPISRTKSDEEKALDAAASKFIKRHIKAQMLLHNVDMAIVATRLTEMGRPITKQGLINKISTSKHQTTWYWDLMKAIKGN